MTKLFVTDFFAVTRRKAEINALTSLKGSPAGTWVDFMARTKQNFVQLRWSTSSDVNSNQFELQHSYNRGQSWTILGRFEASKEGFLSS